MGGGNSCGGCHSGHANGVLVGGGGVGGFQSGKGGGMRNCGVEVGAVELDGGGLGWGFVGRRLRGGCGCEEFGGQGGGWF